MCYYHTCVILKRRGKRLNETSPLSDNAANLPPPEVTDEFLYAHINEMIEIIELKSKLIADWFRPAECQTNPELQQQYDQTYLQYKEQMDAKCQSLEYPQRGARYDRKPQR
ncbi:hypothetical protein CEXT_805571 [Caerostris extrusa]|uniref:Uncharacterized protein n=1 Tax=Caerostris extrusa TaxID=172846 RepID=A0AAV4WFC3_CAEEX|nr:hypothetical protein CEXT_805571 [Caerostris extrusa]